MKKPQPHLLVLLETYRSSYVLNLALILRLCRGLQQLLFVFLNLFLETHVLLTDHRLQYPQLRAKKHHKSFRKTPIKFKVHLQRHPASPVQHGQTPSPEGAAQRSEVVLEALGSWLPPRSAYSSALGAPPQLQHRFQ